MKPCIEGAVIMKSLKRTIAPAVSLALVAFAAWGCGETGDTDPTPVQTFKITPAADATERPATESTDAPATSEPTGGSPDGTPPAGGSTTLTVAGVSNEFDPEELEAPPGTINMTFDNRDSGVIHNIHVHRGSDNDGESVAESDLEVGPIEQTVTFDAEPGEYYYACDAHPTTMEGTLTVE
jgi:plastocyanin